MSTVTERARAGATHLDEVAVGWAEKIDGERLSINSGTDGVLSQVFGDHCWNVRIRLGLTNRQCADLGFCSEVWLSVDNATRAAMTSEDRAAHLDAVAAEYHRLEAAWLAEIEARLEESRLEAWPVATYASPL